jgi:uncharacterized protein (TIGR02996 family)
MVSPARGARDLAQLRSVPRFRAECERRLAGVLAPPPVSAAERRLLAAIRAQPHDDAPRLAYAEWLSLQPSAEARARGELIALQVGYNDLSPADRRGSAMRARAAAIEEDHYGLWSRWFGGGAIGWDRGNPIVDASVVTDHPWVQGAEVSRADPSISRFSALSLGENGARDVLASPHLASVAWLRIPASAAIALPEHLETLCVLEIRGGIVNWLNASARTIAGIAAPALRTLVIEVDWPHVAGQPRTDVAMTFVSTLAAWPSLADVRRLAILGVSGLSTAHALQLCAATRGDLCVDFAGSNVDIAELARNLGPRIHQGSSDAFTDYRGPDRSFLLPHGGFRDQLRPAPEARAEVVAWLNARATDPAASKADAIERELREALPTGWELRRTTSLEWEIIPDGEVARLAPLVKYDVVLTGCLRWVLVFHGNTDAGVDPHMLLQCTALSTDGLRAPAPLRLCDSFRTILSTAKPNRYGLT